MNNKSTSTSTTATASTSTTTSRSLSSRTSAASTPTDTSFTSPPHRYPTQPAPKYSGQPFSAWKQYLGERPDQAWIDYKKEMIGEKEPSTGSVGVGSVCAKSGGGSKNGPRSGVKLVKSSSDPTGLGAATVAVAERAKARTKDMGMKGGAVKKT